MFKKAIVCDRDFAHGVHSSSFNNAFKDFDSTKVTLLRVFIRTDSPVCGLRPLRVGIDFTLNTPRLGNCSDALLLNYLHLSKNYPSDGC